MTVWVVWLVVDLLIQTGRPIVIGVARALRPTSADLADMLLAGWFQSALALLIALALLALIGRIANAVVGRRVIRLVNRLVDAIPLARTVYGATQTLIDALRGDGALSGQKVVLIEFPTPEMRAVGIVTRIFPATDTREELAAVYVATTPNPASSAAAFPKLRRNGTTSTFRCSAASVNRVSALPSCEPSSTKTISQRPGRAPITPETSSTSAGRLSRSL